jgi:hypothetical protein
MRHDRRFHDLVLGATGNERLVATVDGLRDATVTLGASTVDCSRSLPTWPPSTSRCRPPWPPVTATRRLRRCAATSATPAPCCSRSPLVERGVEPDPAGLELLGADAGQGD